MTIQRQNAELSFAHCPAAENIVAGIGSRKQLLKLVAVLTRPKPKPNARGE